MAPKCPDATLPLSGPEIVIIFQNGRARMAKASDVAPVRSVNGKSGAVSLAKADVGLGSVDNTPDSAKPLSAAQQAALNLKTQNYDSNGQLLTNPKILTVSKTTTGGVATIYLTDNGLATGNALFASGVLAVQPQANDSSTVYAWSWTISADRKTLTLTAKKSATPLLSLLGVNILAQPANVPDGTVVFAVAVGY